MDVNYHLIGKRIAHRRKQLHLNQSTVAERADISNKYLSNIERATSIPSTEVILRLALALETTPDEFLVGTSHPENARWQNAAQYLRTMDDHQLDIAESFLAWLSEQK